VASLDAAGVTIDAAFAERAADRALTE